MADARLLLSLTEAELDAKLDRLVAAVSELQAAPAPALLDRDGLARALSCSPKTVDRLRAEPNFPELRLCDSPRFELQAVLTWLRNRTASGTGLRVIGGTK